MPSPGQWTIVGAMKLEFITSAADPGGWPKASRPEIAIAGRSNAGKSSFLNVLSGNKVAKVSQTPGKTRLLNFFEAGESYRLVDMPGYGFSKRSGDEQASWGELIETYVRAREVLLGVLLLADIRREWSEEEQMVLDYAQANGRQVAVALTKADTVSRNEINKRKAAIQKASGERDLFTVSIRDQDSVLAVEDFMFRQWVKKR